VKSIIQYAYLPFNPRWKKSFYVEQENQIDPNDIEILEPMNVNVVREIQVAS